MGLLADSKQKQKQKYHNQFISLYDSVLYLGEPTNESLQFIIDIMPYQSFLHLGGNGLQAVLIDNNVYCFNGVELYKDDIISQLTQCITAQTITPANAIYKLGFGKKRFLSYLLQNGIEPPQKDIETAQSPDLFFDDYQMETVDYYTLQAIMEERDELRILVNELKQQNAPKITPQGDDLLILGVVMTTLSENNINPYTQTKLIQTILTTYGHITGISESTLNKKFAESKKYLQQNL